MTMRATATMTTMRWWCACAVTSSFALLASCVAAAAYADEHCDQLSCTAEGEIFEFSWVVDETYQTLNATMRGVSQGTNTWLAVGLANGVQDPMAGGSSPTSFSDMIIGSYSSVDGFVVRDYHTSEKTNPSLDTSQDVFIDGSRCEYDAGNQTLAIAFWRYLDTGDSADDKPISTGSSLTLLWAYNEYEDSISTDGVTLSKHDTTARNFVPGYTFESGAGAAATCPLCEGSSLSQYDERVAECVSNGWPAVKEVGDFVGDATSFAFTLTCSVCTTAKLTDQATNFVAGILDELLSQVTDVTDVALSNKTDVPAPSPTVSYTATVRTSAGSGADVKAAVEAEYNSNNGASFVNAINAAQSATTVSASQLVGEVVVVGGDVTPESCLSNADSSWTATWTVMDGGEAINITMSSTVSGPDGWVGIGFHASGDFPVNKMGPGDFYIGSVGDGVSDLYLAAAANGQPTADAQNDVLEGSSCSYDGPSGVLQCSFQRRLVTGDASGQDVDIVAESPVGVLYAASDSAFPAIHTLRGAADVAIDLTEACASITAEVETRPLAIAHGILMTIAWMLLLPWGAFIARFRVVVGMNDGGDALWFRLHQPIQYIGIVVMIVSIVLIIVDAGVISSSMIAASTTRGSHYIVGIIVATLAISQPVLAFCRNGCGRNLPEDVQQSAHKRWHCAHAVIGILSLWLGLAACYLGVQELGGSLAVNSLFLAGFVVSIVGTVVFMIVGSVLQMKSKKKHSHSITVQALTSEHGESAEFSELGAQGKATAGAAAAAGQAVVTPASGCGRSLPWLMAAVQIVAVILCALGILQASNESSFQSAAVTDEVTGEYSFCNYMPGYPVTTDETQYFCHAFAFPDVSGQQVIRYKPLLDQTRVLHHMILYESADADPTGGFFDCSTMPPGSTPMYAWAPGSDEFTLPSNVGFDTPKFGILQVHYNNPNGLAGLVDRSGVLMEITSTKREYSAGFLIAGISNRDISVPPGKSAYGLAQDRVAVPSSLNGAQVFSSVLHMHLIGKRIWTRLYRDGVALLDPATGTDALGHQDAYDYNFQAFGNRDVVLQSGDELETTCVFENTVERGIAFGNPNAAAGKTVTGGESTQEEMCLSFIAYYPKASGSAFSDSNVVCDDDDAALPDCADWD